MNFNVLTLFPRMFTGPLQESIIGRARERGLIDINLIDIRDYTDDKHRVTDDYPYGGGAGMVIKLEPVFRARKEIIKDSDSCPSTILFTPQGRCLDQDIIKEYTDCDNMILLCGHYEGVDERIRQKLVDDELSIGDYVLTGGELPAMVFIDAVTRLLPGALGDANSVRDDSFYQGILSYPQYTRPREFAGMEVPEVLLSGNHEKIRYWRKKQALLRTLQRRPDLIEKKKLTDEEEKFLSEIRQEMES